MISVSNSDGSPQLSEGDPLEKELNLTEYEMRVRAANQFNGGMSEHNEQASE